jgi:hypothetical protein
MLTDASLRQAKAPDAAAVRAGMPGWDNTAQRAGAVLDRF